MLDSNTLYVKDENGKEVAMEILFTFANEEMGKQYVVFVDPNDDSGEVFASESEWEMVEEVLGAFNEEEL